MKNQLPDTAAAAADNEKEQPVDPITLVVGGAIAAAAFLRKKAAQAGGIVIDAAKSAIFTATIPSEAQPYSDIILRVASEQAVDPLLIVALGMRESRWGTTLSANGTGDGGHGYGLMQIDDRTWGDWLAANRWNDPYTNVTKGVQILKTGLSYFAGKGLSPADQLQAAVAAYNHGPGNVWTNIRTGGMAAVDNGTAGGDYSSDVVGKLSSYTTQFQNAVQYAQASGQLPGGEA